MEGKKKKASGGEATRSIADELFGKKEEQLRAYKSSSSSSPSGYFNAIFPPPATVLERQRAAERQSAESEAKQQGGGSGKKQSSYKDGDVAVGYSTEPSEPCYYGSSVHYGGRDFYTSPTSSKSSSQNTSAKYQNNGEYDDPNYADRGDWWQGSLYY